MQDQRDRTRSLARDLARKIVEQAKAGAGLLLFSLSVEDDEKDDGADKPIIIDREATE